MVKLAIAMGILIGALGGTAAAQSGLWPKDVYIAAAANYATASTAQLAWDNNKLTPNEAETCGRAVQLSNQLLAKGDTNAATDATYECGKILQTAAKRTQPVLNN